VQHIDEEAKRRLEENARARESVEAEDRRRRRQRRLVKEVGVFYLLSSLFSGC
jgi:hypothetical protein